LKELANMQDTLPAYFKGGTALYKALHSIRRFSEDIDLTVCIDGCTNSQAKKRLDRAANGYLSLPRTVQKSMESNSKGSITSVYVYESVIGAAIIDPLQRFTHVKVEATSFTVSEPYAPLTIYPMVYNAVDSDQRKVLKDMFGVEPFVVNTICLERIFIDKVFAAEFYYERKEYFDVAKHIYDLAVMSKLDVIRTLLEDTAQMSTIIAYKRQEEKVRIGSDLSHKRISSFTLFDGMHGDRKLKDAFLTMQDIYVMSKSDLIPFSDMAMALGVMRSKLIQEQIAPNHTSLLCMKSHISPL
jgi:predicted nucleotidyltransferase component of viral defense system